jgi:hypothetical protein
VSVRFQLLSKGGKGKEDEQRLLRVRPVNELRPDLERSDHAALVLELVVDLTKYVEGFQGDLRLDNQSVLFSTGGKEERAHIGDSSLVRRVRVAVNGEEV